MAAKKVAASIGLPFGIGQISGEWEPDDTERQAAWEMYVELITRVALVELGPNEGLLREALSSYYSLFDTTRQILRDAGPSLAKERSNGGISFGRLAITILNSGLRPLLAYWHPVLEDYEHARPADVSRIAWEREWFRHDELRAAMDEVRESLRSYAELLAEVTDAQSLLAGT